MYLKKIVLLLKITYEYPFSVLLSLILLANCQGLNSPSAARDGKQMYFGCLSYIQSCVLRYVPACGGTALLYDYIHWSCLYVLAILQIYI